MTLPRASGSSAPSVFVAAWVGSKNLGDELLFASLTRRLRELGCGRIVVPSVAVEAMRALHGVEAVPHRDLRAQSEAIGSCDALVFGGGGLLQDDTSRYNVPFQLSRLWLATLHGKPWAGVGLGVGPLRSLVSRTLVRATLANHRGFVVRDAQSLELLQRLGVRGARLAADMALSLPPVDSEPRAELVAVLRPYRSRRRFEIGLHAPRADERFVTEMAKGLDGAARRFGLTTRLVAFEAGRDDGLNREIAAHMETPAECVVPSLQSAIDEVARGRVVVAMRYHGAVAAVLAGRPLVTVGYLPKVDSLAAELGRGCRALTNQPSVFAGLADAVEQVQNEADAVRAAREVLREREAGNREVLRDLLRSVSA